LDPPVAVAPPPFAWLPLPVAVAVAASPFAVLNAPVAVAPAPVAFATEPTAVAKAVVARKRRLDRKAHLTLLYASPPDPTQTIADGRGARRWRRCVMSG